MFNIPNLIFKKLKKNEKRVGSKPSEKQSRGGKNGRKYNMIIKLNRKKTMQSCKIMDLINTVWSQRPKSFDYFIFSKNSFGCITRIQDPSDCNV